MAAREYVDDVLKTGRQREYAITDLGTGFSNITESQDALEVVGSTFGEANAMGDMVLECDVSVASNVTTVSHPSGEPHQFWFEATADHTLDTIFMFQQGENTPETLTLLDIDGSPYTVPAWRAGDYVRIQRMGTSARVLAPLAGKVDAEDWANGFGDSNLLWTGSWVSNSGTSITVPDISKYAMLTLYTNVGAVLVLKAEPGFFRGFGCTKPSTSTNMYTAGVVLTYSGDTLTFNAASTGYLQVSGTGASPSTGQIVIAQIYAQKPTAG